MSTAFKILVSLGLVAAVLVLLLGPRWRGAFYQSWLRPRLIAMGVLIAVFTGALYLFKVFNALGTR